jgi:uncharacterized protein YciI
MNPAEAEAMSAHAAYLTDLTDKGIGFAFGPVFDPNGVFGMGIIEAADEGEARALTEKDPVVVAGIGRYEIFPMRLSITRKG